MWTQLYVFRRCPEFIAMLFQSLDDLSNSCHDESMHIHAFISDTGMHLQTFCCWSEYGWILEV